MTMSATSVILEDLQQQRAAFQVDTFKGFLQEAMNGWEKALLKDYQEAANARIDLATLDAAIARSQASTTAASGGALSFGAGFSFAAVTSRLSFARADVAAQASKVEASMQEHALRASIEQRRQEWTLQLGLAQSDVAISAQQVTLAKDHQQRVGQERTIAGIQLTNPRPRRSS
jgi:hypothetical protein